MPTLTRIPLTFDAVSQAADDLGYVYRSGAPGRFRYALIRYGRGFIVAQWHSGHSNWTVSDLAGGYGYARDPEGAADQCRRPAVVTLREARNEIERYREGV